MPERKDPELIDREGSLLLVVDMQEKLAPKISGIEALTLRNKALIDAAALLRVPVVFTEQYPKGLGHTNPDLLAAAPDGEVIEKIHFDAAAEDGTLQAIESNRSQQIVVTGTEAHVCVLQTVIGLHGRGLDMRLVTDATGSRREADKTEAIARLRGIGVGCVTTEMVIFEWLRQAGTERFRQILPIIRALVPETPTG